MFAAEDSKCAPSGVNAMQLAGWEAEPCPDLSYEMSLRFEAALHSQSHGAIDLVFTPEGRHLGECESHLRPLRHKHTRGSGECVLHCA